MTQTNTTHAPHGAHTDNLEQHVMTIENSFERIAAALEGIGTRIDALGAAIAALNLTATPTPTHLNTLAEVVQAEVVQAEVVADDAPAPEPKKRGRPALKAVETAPAGEAAPVVEEAPAPLAPAEEAPAATEDAVKTAILAYAGKHGKLAALAILERHGAARVRDLNPSTYGAVLADIAKG